MEQKKKRKRNCKYAILASVEKNADIALRGACSSGREEAEGRHC